MEHTVLPDKGRARLDRGVLDIWHAQFSGLMPRFSQLRALLTEPERDRAAGFVHADAMRAFVLGRGMLRSLLGHYLDCDPTKIQISTSTSGKPFANADLQFNLSHSDDQLLLGFMRGQAVGVDIQRIDPNFHWQKFVDQVFAAGDNPPDVSEVDGGVRAFTRCWVMKEALVKAEGMGLGLPLASFPARSANSSKFPCGFVAEEIETALHYVAAWAVHGKRPYRIDIKSS